MDLVAQFIAMGMTPEQAQEYADNFVKGLQELGVSDDTNTEPVIETPDVSVPDPSDFQMVSLFQSQPKSVGAALIKVGVRAAYIKLYSDALGKAFAEADINTSKRKAMFLAQVLHESGMFTMVKENLNYSEEGLLKVFGKYFDRNSARAYARKPEKIANRVYANRMGNGPESSGDGWKYRGRGLIQLTGKNNYAACGKLLGVDLIKNPDYLTTPEGAARSAAWFWKTRALNTSADKGDIMSNTKLINGGYKGIEDRTNLYRKLLPLV